MHQTDLEKVIYKIKVGDLQSAAQEALNRALTKSEIEDVTSELENKDMKVMGMLIELIEDVIALNKVLKRNNGAKENPEHYLVYWKNENIYQKEYKELFASLNEKDAHYFIVHRENDPNNDKYKITHVSGNTETDVAVVPSSQENPMF